MAPVVFLYVTPSVSAPKGTRRSGPMAPSETDSGQRLEAALTKMLQEE